MEKFPFEQLIGFLVFLIVALSQVWTSLRERKKQKSQSDQQKPTPSQQPSPIFEKPLQDLLEALGMPSTPHLPRPKIQSKIPLPTPNPKKVFTKPVPLLKKTIERPVLNPKSTQTQLTTLLKKSASYSASNRWQNLLKNRNQIQQAIVLNEILGKPKGLTYFGS